MRPDATSGSLSPSPGLLTAAFAGLLAFGASGCEEDENDPFRACENEDSGGPLLPAADAGSDAATEAGAPMSAADAGAADSGPMDGGAAADAAAGHMPSGDAATGPITTQEVEGNRTLASLTSDCEARGGYLQIHAACAGANTCQGFSYGDWQPGVLTEHSCASANGCNGASCVALQTETTRTGQQVYEAENLPAGGPASCLNCHAVWNGKDAMGNYLPPDKTKFKVWVMPGSTRTLENWLQMTAEEQEAIVAFGKVGYMPGVATAQVSMRGYHKLLSRGEVERVVAYIRTLTPVITEIKTPQ